MHNPWPCKHHTLKCELQECSPLVNFQKPRNFKNSLLKTVVSALPMEEVKVSNTAMIKEYLKWEKSWSSLTHFVLQSVIGRSEVSLKSMKIFLSDISKVAWSLITANNLCDFSFSKFCLFYFQTNYPFNPTKSYKCYCMCVNGNLHYWHLLELIVKKDPSDPFKHTSSENVKMLWHLWFFCAVHPTRQE